VHRTPTNTRDLLHFWYGTEIRLQPYETTYSIGTTATAIGKYANQRTAILVANLHASQILYIGFSSGVSATNGTPLSANQWFAWNWVNDNEIAMRDMWAIASGAATPIYVLESVLAPVVDG
jgi:hypothetical protein